jgi:CheY-like chemotaxis protein/cold shock CspA family protein
MPILFKGNSMKKKTILINDDEPMVTEMLAKEFKRRGFNVVETHSSHDALKHAREETPDLIVTDINLPDMKGTELAETLVQENIFVPIIAISGEGKINPENYLFFQKPLSTRKLGDMISDHLSEIADLQLLRNISMLTGVSDANLGKVMCFYHDKGWGLLRVLNREKPLYVNAADVMPKNKFTQLFKGQVVKFEVKDSDRGPRADNVSLLFDQYTNQLSPAGLDASVKKDEAA